MTTDTLRSTRWLAAWVGAVMAAWAPVDSVAAAGSQASTAQTLAAYQLACAPRAVRSMAPPSLHLVGSPMPGRRLFGPGDLVLLDRGSDEGLAVGQQLAVRRLVPGVDRAAARRDPWLRIHTAGWVRLVEVEPAAAIATVVYACDALETGDFLEPFALPEVPAPASAGRPDYEQAGHVLFADERRTMAGPPTFVVIDLGAEQGLRPGQRVTLFRRLGGRAGPPVPLGEGLALIVLPESATIRIERATEPVIVGDLAAPHRP